MARKALSFFRRNDEQLCCAGYLVLGVDGRKAGFRRDDRGDLVAPALKDCSRADKNLRAVMRLQRLTFEGCLCGRNSTIDDLPCRAAAVANQGTRKLVVDRVIAFTINPLTADE